MSGFSAPEAKSFLHALLVFFSSDFSNFDDIYIHDIGVVGFGGSGEGVVGLMSMFGVSFGNFIGVELCSALGWDLNFLRPSSYVSRTRLVGTSPYYQFPESREPSSRSRPASLTLFCF